MTGYATNSDSICYTEISPILLYENMWANKFNDMLSYKWTCATLRRTKIIDTYNTYNTGDTEDTEDPKSVGIKSVDTLTLTIPDTCVDAC
jgi:hypothetical protein